MFPVNPSFLIASQLAPYLYAEKSTIDQPGDDTTSIPTIKVIVHPLPVRVSYLTVASLLPTLLAQHGDPDFIVHIGMAAGRHHYALETLTRRDGYIIKDVDGCEDRGVGEVRRKADGLPECLRVGWDPIDVFGRWRDGLRKDIKSEGQDMVRLSTDAGKFLCEFILYESLGTRAVEDAERGTGKKGKVAFLHVPGAVDGESVSRGVRVAEAAIRAIVGSWEDGLRAEGFAV